MDHERAVSQLLSSPAARLMIPDPDDTGKTQLLKGVICDPRVENHFAGRCIFVSCDEGTNAASHLIRSVAAGLGILLKEEKDLEEVKNLLCQQRTLVVIDKLDAIYSPWFQKQQDVIDATLGLLASIGNVSLVVSLGGPSSIPKSVAWTNAGDFDEDMQLEPELSLGSATNRRQEPYTTAVQEVHGKALDRPSMISRSKIPPAQPEVFHGRDKEVERLVSLALVPNAAPLGIIGPGGIGKTTLSLKVLHDARIRDQFGKERFFVTCESATSPDEVLAALALKLGVKPSQDMPLLSGVLNNLRARGRVFLVIDNFETIWSPTDGSIRGRSEVFLAQLAAIDELTIIVTTRGNHLPEMFTWANADTAELDTLSFTAARQTFHDLSFLEPDILASETETKALAELLREVDFMPLAVTLLARLDDLPSRLLLEWSEHKTDVLEADRHDGTRRELSVEVSIKISLAHLPAETGSVRPRQLLSVLGQLPSGLYPATSDKLRPVIPNIDMAAHDLLRHSLAYTSGLGELRILNPVRHYISSRLPMSRKTQYAVIKLYIDLGAGHPRPDRLDIDGPTYDTEITNIISILTAAVDVVGSQLLDLIMAFPQYCTYRSHSCLQLVQRLLPKMEGDVRGTANCLHAIAGQLENVGDVQSAVESLTRAADIYADLGHSTESNARASLARCLGKLGRKEDAELQQIRADALERASPQDMYRARPAPGDDLAAAEMRYRAHLEDLVQRGDEGRAVQLCDRILELVKQRGDTHAYIKELEAAMSLSEKYPSEQLWLSSIKLRLAVQYLQVDEVDGAEELLVDAYAIMSGVNSREGVAAVTRGLGRVRFKQGHIDEGTGLLQTAAKLERELGKEETAETIEQELEQLRSLPYQPSGCAPRTRISDPHPPPHAVPRIPYVAPIFHLVCCLILGLRLT